MQMTAKCHCGAVRLAFTLKGSMDDLHRCDCSLCRRVKAAAVSSDKDDLKVVAGADSLAMYQFGTCTARHFFCKTCGTHTHHQRRSDPSEIGINVGCLDNVDARLASAATWVDGVKHPSDD